MEDKVRVQVTELTPQSDLDFWAQDESLVLDVTHLDLRRLPAIVFANLYTESQDFVAPFLQEAASISGPNVLKFETRRLRKMEDLLVPYTLNLVMNEVEEIGQVNARTALSVFWPKLVSSGDQNLQRITIYASPELVVAGNVDARNADYAFAPKALYLGSLNIHYATKADLSGLQVVGDFDGDNLKRLDARNLVEAGNFRISRAELVNLPALEIVGDFSGQELLDFSAKNLQRSGHLRLWKSSHVSIPMAEATGDMDLYSATELTAPRVRLSGSIDAKTLRHFEMNELQGSGFINVPEVTRYSTEHLRQSDHVIAPKTGRHFNAPELQLGYVHAHTMKPAVSPQAVALYFDEAGAAITRVIRLKATAPDGAKTIVESKEVAKFGLGSPKTTIDQMRINADTEAVLEALQQRGMRPTEVLEQSRRSDVMDRARFALHRPLIASHG